MAREAEAGTRLGRPQQSRSECRGLEPPQLELGGSGGGLLGAGREALAHAETGHLPSRPGATPHITSGGSLTGSRDRPRSLRGVPLSPSCPEAAGTLGHRLLDTPIGGIALGPPA